MVCALQQASKRRVRTIPSLLKRIRGIFPVAFVSVFSQEAQAACFLIPKLSLRPIDTLFGGVFVRAVVTGSKSD